MRFFLFLIIPIFLFSKDLSESIVSEMSLDEKIGQLFIIPVSPIRDEEHRKVLKEIINQYHIGGLIVKQSDPNSQIECLNYLQRECKLPLIVMADAEWGLGMRMSNVISYPQNIYLGKLENNQLIYDLGKEIARQLKLVGVHLNLAPVVDVNSNPSNPVIKSRSFSADPEVVSEKASYFVKGQNSENILSCAKHFPGHGDTEVDSHRGLPIIKQDRKRLDNIELKPYARLISEGIDSIMTAHILFPLLSDLPATMSKEVIQGLLRDDMHFKGIIISDALNMKALTEHYSIEEIALKSHMAGVDLLLYGAHKYEDIDDILLNHIPRAFKAIKKAYEEKLLEEKKLDEHLLRILKAKEKLTLFKNRFVEEFDEEKLNSKNAYDLQDKIEKAIVN